MSLRFQFVLGAGLPSRLIAWWGNGYGGYSHVDVLMPDGTLVGARSDVIRGIEPGVRRRPADYEKWKRKTVISIPMADVQTKAAHDFALGQIGQQYDKEAILGFILGRRLHSAGHWICSAFGTQVARAAGLFGKLPVPEQQISPNSLYLMLSACDGITILDR